MKKTILLILAVLTVMIMIPACGTTETEESYDSVTINLGGLIGPTSMGMVKLLDDAENGLTENNYEFTLSGAADELTPKLLKGELDILAVPANLGAILYNNSDGGVQMIAANSLGIMYIVEKGGDSVQSLKDLKGKTIISLGKGSTPEFALNYLLEEAGLDPEKDVTVEWKSESSEIVAAMATEENTIALLPEPFITVAQSRFDDFRVAVDLNEEWNSLENGSKLVTAGLIVRKAFADEHPEAVAKFLEEYNASTKYVNENVEESAKLIEKYGIIKADVAVKAVPNCNIVCITGKEMKEITEGYFGVLNSQDAAFVGGSLPGEDFYWIYE